MNTISTIDGYKIKQSQYAWQVTEVIKEVTHKYEPILFRLDGPVSESDHKYWKLFFGCNDECDNLNNAMKDDFVWVLGFDASSLCYHPIIQSRDVVWNFNKKKLGQTLTIYETHSEAIQAADILNQ